MYQVERFDTRERWTVQTTLALKELLERLPDDARIQTWLLLRRTETVAEALRALPIVTVSNAPEPAA